MGNVRRRTVFIKPAFQMRWVAWTIALLTLASLCSALVLYVLLASEIGSEMQTAHHQLVNTWQRLWPAVLSGAVAAVVIASLAGALAVIFISHKIAGPLHRFERVCAEVGQGHWEVSAKIRDRDQLRGLSDAFSHMLEQLRALRAEQQAHLSKARQTLDGLRAAAAMPADALQSLDRLSDDLAALSDAIGGHG